MIDSKLKAPYQTFLINPLLKLPFMKNLKATTLTLCGLIIGLLTGVFIGFGYTAFAICMLLLSGFFDTLDGSLARFQNKASEIGAIFDITADRCVEFAIILGLFFVDPVARGLQCLLMLGSVLICITTFLVVGIFSKNTTDKSFYYNPGIIERAEAFIFFTAMILFPGKFTLLSLTFATLVFLTAFIRIKETLNNSFTRSSVKKSKIH